MSKLEILEGALTERKKEVEYLINPLDPVTYIHINPLVPVSYHITIYYTKKKIFWRLLNFLVIFVKILEIITNIWPSCTYWQTRLCVLNYRGLVLCASGYSWDLLIKYTQKFVEYPPSAINLCEYKIMRFGDFLNFMRF